MKVKVQTLDAKAGGDIQLDDAVFGVEPRADILHRVVTWQLINRRAPARGARERSDVRRVAVPPVTAIAAPRSSSAAARLTVRGPGYSPRASTRRFVHSA